MKKNVLRKYLELRKMKKINKKLGKIANELLLEKFEEGKKIFEELEEEKPKRTRKPKGEK